MALAFGAWAMAGCGPASHSGKSTTRTTVITVNGRTYIPAQSVRAVNTAGLEVDGLDYITPSLLSAYPKESVVVFEQSPYRGGPYIWTGTSLVLLIPACVEEPSSLGGCG